MIDQVCLIDGCKARAYAPAGTRGLCREHFLDFVKWRRRRGMQMFFKYGAMTMDERDPIVEEWRKNVRVEEPASTPPPVKR